MEPQRMLPYFILTVKTSIRTQQYVYACVVLVRRLKLFFLHNAKNGVFQSNILKWFITKSLNLRRFYIISFYPLQAVILLNHRYKPCPCY